MSEQNIYQMLAAAGDAAFVVDDAGEICFWNSAAERLFQIPGPQAVGKPCSTLLAGTGSDHHAICLRECSVLEMAQRGQGIPAFDLEVRTPVGNRWVALSTLVATTPAGLRIVHLARDIGIAKNLEQFTEQFLEQVCSLGEPPFGAYLSQNPHVQLTERETAVLDLLAHGQSTVQISKHLSISTSTVRHHVQQVLHKLHAHSRTEAVVRAVHDHLT